MFWVGLLFGGQESPWRVLVIHAAPTAVHACAHVFQYQLLGSKDSDEICKPQDLSSTPPKIAERNIPQSGAGFAALPVTLFCQEHQMTLLRCHEDLRQHHQNEKSVLQDLQDLR